MQAGAEVEDLRIRCPYFYDVAEQLHSLLDSERLVSFVTKTFQRRYKVMQLPAYARTLYQQLCFI